MPFVKVVKNKAYFKRYQVKYRRRREGKTDYRARKRLITQDKNKYGSPKYRLVVRFTNKHCICQIVYSEIVGDKVLCHASSAELPRYGMNAGLKNYAAAYCTGLLVARRLLDKIGLAEVYEGNLTYDDEDEDFEYLPEVVSTEANKRTYFVEELDDDKNPFRALLDVGIITTTTGSRVFAALKGAADGGLDIPHSEKRFPGYDRETKKYDAEVHKERIFGEHVAEYMRYLMEEDSAKYKSQFKEFIANEYEADDLEELYQDVHKKIREDPKPSPKSAYDGDKTKFKKPVKKSFEQRREDMEAKRAKFEEDNDEDEEDEDDEEEDDE
jgi:large subunit ribosomal protein L5e